jgi:hypothetical protein
MRRWFVVLALVAVAAAALTATASAKEGGVELSSTPFGIGPGDPWDGTLTVFSPGGTEAAFSPSITIRNLDTGLTQTFPATPSKAPAGTDTQSYDFTVVFPTAGRYRYTATDGLDDREYAYPIVRIVDQAPATLAGPPATPEGGFALWPLVAGLGGAAALALVAFLAIRSRRFAH